MSRLTIALVACFGSLGGWSTALGQPPERFQPLLRWFDTDQDGTLSAAEMASADRDLSTLDQNGDGRVTSEEFRKGLRPGGAFGHGGLQNRPPVGNRGRRGAEPVRESDFEQPPLAKDEREQKCLDALETMREGPRFANVSTTDGRLLRLLAESLDARNVVEIGTSTGESAVWLALALRATGGHLFTHEIDKERAKIAQENFKHAGVDDLITVVIGDAHETVTQHESPIDMVFLDADKEGYLDYLEKLLPLVRPGGLIVAHNMNTRQADLRFVQAITENPALETLVLLKEGTGVSVTLKKRQ